MTSKTFATTAAEMREHLQLLRLERAIADTADTGYVSDLEDEIASTQTAYVGAAVTEIASLRGELSGRARG